MRRDLHASRGSAARIDWRDASPGAACVRAGTPHARRSPRPAIPGTGPHRTTTGNGSEYAWVVSAWRSLWPLNPTSRTATPACRASCAATQPVLAPRFSTMSKPWLPVPSGSKPRISSTTKSSGSRRIAPVAGGRPCAQGATLMPGTAAGSLNARRVRACARCRRARAARWPGRQGLRRARARRVLPWSWP